MAGDLGTGVYVKKILDALTSGLGLTFNGSAISSTNLLPTLDGGPYQSVIRTYTASADMTTAAAITATPDTGKKVVAMDIVVSTDTAMNIAIQMETSANVLAKFYMPANSTLQITLRGYIKGDAVNKRIFGKASVSGNVAFTVVQFSEA